jgi:hypothetical protein
MKSILLQARGIGSKLSGEYIDCTHKVGERRADQGRQGGTRRSDAQER